MLVGPVLGAHLGPVLDRMRTALQADAAGDAAEPVDIEAAMEPLLRELAGVVVSFLAGQVDGGRVANRHVCSCGGHYQFVRKQLRWIGALFGEVRPLRALYRCRACGKGRVPLDQVLGLQSGAYRMGRSYLAPRAQEMLGRLVAALPYEEARRHFQALTGLKVSGMLGWRLAQRLGRQLQQQQAQVGEPAARETGQRPRWLVSADGVMVAFWRGGRQRRARKAGSKKQRNGIRWQEVKVGLVAQLDKTGAVVRGSQSYLICRVSAEAFRRQMSRMAKWRGVLCTDVVAVVTDGAKWLRALATRHFPEATAVRDFFHAAQHLTVMAVALYGEGSRAATKWQKTAAKRLKAGAMAAMLAEWSQLKREPKDARVWERERKYFASQQAQMAYDQFREARLPIGSGAIEGACKSTVASRFRRPGARWSEEGFRNLAALRARYCTGGPLMP